MRTLALLLLAALLATSSVQALAAKAPEGAALPVATRDLDGRIRDAYGLLTPPSGGDPVALADAFLDARLLPLGVSPASEMTLSSVRTSLTATHVRYQQTFAGIPVVRGEVSVHVRHDGAVIATHSRAVERLADAPLLVTAQEATRVALEAEPGRALAVRPVIQPDGLVGLPAWEVEVESLDATSRPLVRVSRQTGDILATEDLQHTFAEAAARVWINPIVATGNADLRDNPSNFERPLAGPLGMRDFTGLMTEVTLQLDDAARLKGPYVHVIDAKASGSYVFPKEDPRFEEVAAYYWMDWTKRELDLLGFTEVMNYTIPVQNYDPTMMGVFNAFYRRVPGGGTGEIHFGWHAPTADLSGAGPPIFKGFADSAEDSEVIVHEYAHAVLDNQVPNFNGGHMHEGWADFFSSTMLARESNGNFDWCMAEWFTSYIMRSSGGRPPCLRTLENDLTIEYSGTGHALGQVWSGSLWNIRAALGPTAGETLILEANFLLPVDGSFHEGAEALLMADGNLNQAANARLIVGEFGSRNITGLIVTEDLLAKIQAAGGVSLASAGEATTGAAAVPGPGVLLAMGAAGLVALALRRRT